MAEQLCESGCGCRYGTDDPDRLDCACDGPCCEAGHDVWFHGGLRCPGPACVTQGATVSSLYPEGYCDPAWDGTEAGFRDVVLPVRIDAVSEGLNAAFADLLPEGMHFEFGIRNEDQPEEGGEVTRG